uniref:NmrA-like domain-containing protein n=1 Tax=Quercus lobata TaxID=97700 RepID=A0A7N2N1D6_QUELO
MAKSKVLVVGGTGYIGKRIVKASLAQGHITYVLQRREMGLDIDKIQMLLSFKKQGARLIQGSFSDHQSLVDAVKQVDVVICTMSGVHFRSHNILLQLKLVDAIKEAGNIKSSLRAEIQKTKLPINLHLLTILVQNRRRLRQFLLQTPNQTVTFLILIIVVVLSLSFPIFVVLSFLSPSSSFNGALLGPSSSFNGAPNLLRQLRFIPSEFGTDPSRMGHALEPGRVTFDEKMRVRRAIEEAKIPFTYVTANCFAGYFAGNLSQMETLLPPRDKVTIYGDGNVKVVYMDEDDVALYTIKTIDDPRTLNKTLNIRPPENILSQRELVEKWEKLIGKELQKISCSQEDFLASIKGLDFASQVGVGHFYHFFYEGCLTNFEIGEEGEEASELYPDVKYTRMDEYLKLYL